jgi:hypothetical protein
MTIGVPPPPGRGAWRLTLHNRSWSDVTWQSTIITQLDGAMNAKLVQALDTPAVLTFDIDGHSPDCALVAELACDVVAWRWDEVNAVDVPVFRGIVSASQDQIDEDSHLVSFSAMDYLGMLTRRILTEVTQASGGPIDQDNIANFLLVQAADVYSSGNVAHFTPGCYLPLASYWANPDGTFRANSGVTRNYAFQGNTVVATQLDDLSKMANGFDYDILPYSLAAGHGLGGPGVAPGTGQVDSLRIFYPQQGITSGGPALVYGANVSKVTRSVSQADYSNYWRTLGNKQSTAQSAAQVQADRWAAEASGTTYGTFMTGDSSSDQVDPTWLGAVAQGALNLHSTLWPNYTLALAPGAYYWGFLHMGDTASIVVSSGRLNVNNNLRVLGITYVIGDDGAEDVELTVGLATASLLGVMKNTNRDVRALTRR